jgi:hypothetical protein
LCGDATVHERAGEEKAMKPILTFIFLLAITANGFGEKINLLVVTFEKPPAAVNTGLMEDLSNFFQHENVTVHTPGAEKANLNHDAIYGGDFSEIRELCLNKNIEFIAVAYMDAYYSAQVMEGRAVYISRLKCFFRIYRFHDGALLASELVEKEFGMGSTAQKALIDAFDRGKKQLIERLAAKREQVFALIFKQ